jgi:CheY-like chemotaxis protein
MTGNYCDDHHVTILMADDDEDDCLLVRDALEEHPLPKEVRFVYDGEGLLDYLYRRRPDFSSSVLAPRPDLILLDLNMPRIDGREALKEIKADPNLQGIPVAILTTSMEERDIEICRELGANTYIVKPSGFKDLVRAMGTLIENWFGKGVTPS